MSIIKDFAKIIDLDENQVLIKRGYNNDEDCNYISLTLLTPDECELTQSMNFEKSTSDERYDEIWNSIDVSKAEVFLKSMKESPLWTIFSEEEE